MTETDQNATNEEKRLAAIERELKSINAQLDGIRDVISQGQNVLFLANTNRAAEISALKSRLDEIQECAMPTFFKVFPRQGEFLDEVDRLLASRRETEK